MAKKSISDVLVRIKGDNRDLNGALKSSDSSLRNFASSVGHRLKQVTIAFAALSTAVSLYSIKQSMTFEGLDRAFTKMVTDHGRNSDKFMDNMKEMAHGTVSEMDIMKRANMGLLLGLKPDTLLTFMEAASTIAQATGQEVGYMFESLTTGTARQSKLWLDNLGILINVDAANKAYADTLGVEVSALTEAERKLAFVNAAEKESIKKMEDLGGFVLDTKAKWDQLITSFKDASVVLGQRLMPEFDKILTWLVTNKDWMVTTFDEIFNIEIKNFGDLVVTQLDNVKNWIDKNKGDIQWWVDTITGLTGPPELIGGVDDTVAEQAARHAAAASAEQAYFARGGAPSGPSMPLTDLFPTFPVKTVYLEGTKSERFQQSITIVLDHFAVDKFLRGEVVHTTNASVISET